jgi:prolyl oligopeptidase
MDELPEPAGRAVRLMPRDARLRVARPTADLEKVTEMYRNGLGLEDLGSFRSTRGSPA